MVWSEIKGASGEINIQKLTLVSAEIGSIVSESTGVDRVRQYGKKKSEWRC